MLQGVGMGMIFVPLTTLAYRTLPPCAVDQAAAREGRTELESETSQAGDPDAIARLTARLQELEAQGEKAQRRAARVAAKAQAARKEAQAHGLLPLPAEEE